MAKQRSGIPSDDGDPQKTASDGWPAWMGAADPALAPKQPPPPKPKAAAKVPAAAAVPRQAAPVKSRAPEPAAAPPAPAPAKSRPRIGLRIGIWAVVLLWVFVGGVIAARYQPELAVGFQRAAASAGDRAAPLLPPAARLGLSLGIPLVLFGCLVWQSDRPLRPRFVAFALFVCLGTASIGLVRSGRDIDMERSAAAFRSRMDRLRQELDVWKQSATRGTQALSALESKLQAAESDRARSSMAPEQDQILTALRKELEDLKKKLAEKE